MNILFVVCSFLSFVLFECDCWCCQSIPEFHTHVDVLLVVYTLWLWIAYDFELMSLSFIVSFLACWTRMIQCWSSIHRKKKVVANWQFVTSPRPDDEASLIERHPMASNDEYYEYMESQIQSLMIADDDFIKTMNPCLNINLCTTPWIKPKSRATAWRPIKS